jgi:hypothetical protein
MKILKIVLKSKILCYCGEMGLDKKKVEKDKKVITALVMQ